MIKLLIRDDFTGAHRRNPQTSVFQNDHVAEDTGQGATRCRPLSQLQPPNSLQVMATMDVDGDGTVDYGFPPLPPAAITGRRSFLLIDAHLHLLKRNLNFQPIFCFNVSCVVVNSCDGSELVKFIVNSGKDKDDTK